MKKFFSSEASFYSVVFSYVSLFLYGLLDNMRGPIYPSLLLKYDLNNVMGSWFFSTTSLIFMIAAGLAPRVLFKRGYLQSIRESLVLIFASQLIFYFSPNFYGVLLGCILMGYGVGILSVIQNVLVLFASPPKKINQVVNGLHANYAAASLLAPLMVAVIFRLSFTFETIFLVGALISFAILIGSFLIKNILEPVQEVGPHLLAFFKWRYLPVGVLLSSYVAGEVLLSSRLSQYLVDVYSFSSEQASVWTSGFFLSLLLGRLLFTAFHFNITLHKLLKILFLLSILVSLLGLWFFPVALLFVGFLVSPLYAMIMIIAKREFPAEIENVTSLVIVLSGVFIISMNSLVGWLTDHFGIQLAMYLAPGFLSLCFIILMRRFRDH